MTFLFSSKVVALHLDNNTSKAYLCNHGDMASTFLSRLVCYILNLAEMHGINLLPAYLPTHLNVASVYHREGWFNSDGAFFLT